MIQVARTADVSKMDLDAIRLLMDEAFEGDFDDDDWDHTIGGWHVIVRDADRIVSHASVVARTIEVDGRPFATGYVEGVATTPTHQGRGHGTSAMNHIADIVHRDHELGVLGTGEFGFYERLGWVRWQGTSGVRRDGSVVPTPDDSDGIMLLRFGPSQTIPLTGEITCDDRAGDVW